MNRWLLLIPAVACCVATATAQPAAPRAPLSPLVYMIPYLGNAPLHQELKLTDDQVKKLTDFQTTWMTESFNTRGPSTPEGVKARDEAIARADKFLNETLKPDQGKRLRQIGLQRIADPANRLGTARLMGPGVLDELKLTDDQKKKLADNAQFADVLTEAQKATWKEMLGEPFTAQLQQSFGPFAPNGFPRVSVEVRYLQLTSVQQELKLTEDQKAKVTTLVRNRQPVTDQMIGEFLEKTQVGRLKQVMLQHQLKTQGPEAVLTSAPVVEQLALTPEQQTKRDDVLKKYADDFRLAVLSTDPYEKILTKVEAARAARDKSLMGVLDDKQQGKWKEMLGEPFTGELPRVSPFANGVGGLGGDQPPGGGFPGGGQPPGGGQRPGGGQPPPGGFGPGRGPRIPTAPMHLRFILEETVQKDMQFTEAEIKKVKDVEAKRVEMFKGYADLTTRELQAEKRREVAAAVEKMLAEALKPEHAKRLKQLDLQQRTALPFGASVLLDPEVAQALKLTAEQQDKMRGAEEDSTKVMALISEERLAAPRDRATPFRSLMTEYRKFHQERLVNMLTEEQKAAWKEMLGKPFEGRLPGGFGSFGPLN